MLRRLIFILFFLLFYQSIIVAQDSLYNSLIIKYDTASIQLLKNNLEYQYSIPKLEVSNWFDTIKIKLQNILSWIFNTDAFGYLVAIIVGVVFITIITTILIKGKFESISKQEKEFGIVIDNPLVFNGLSKQHQLELALVHKDFRMAFRWRFIIYLEYLSDHQLIKLDSHKSNHDYQRELKGTKWYPKFRTLSRSFDYIWYGHQTIQESDFKKFEELFNTSPDEI